MGAMDPKKVRPYDLAWTQSLQCSRCARFGALYYTEGSANALCTKAGPGRSANSAGTAQSNARIAMWTYHNVETPSFYITVTWPHKKEREDVTVEAYSSEASKSALLTGCRFVATPAEAIGSLDVAATDGPCVLEKLSVPIAWPSACDAGTNLCPVYAVLTGISDEDKVDFREGVGTGKWKPDEKRNLGDTRLFAPVTLATGPSPPAAQESTKKSKITGKKDRYRMFKALGGVDGLRARRGKKLRYQLFTGTATQSSDALACSGGVDTRDVSSSYNSFTYYYPHGGNFLLEDDTNDALVDTYALMLSEQKAAMASLFGKEPKSSSHGFPFRAPNPQKPDNGFTSICVVPESGLCSNQANGGTAGYRYEALPEQNEAYTLEDMTWAPESRYFGDYPNYVEDDVVAGWELTTSAEKRAVWYRDSPIGRKVHRVLTSLGKAYRATASCRFCVAGYEGAPGRSDHGRYLRAVLGPLGEKLRVASVAALPVSNIEYATVCRPCRAGTFNDRAGRSCRPCPKGQFSLSYRWNGRVPAFYGAVAPRRCWQCLRGFSCKRADFARTTKVCDVAKYGNMCPCPVGTYQDERGQEQCKPCPTGSTTAQAGASNLAECRFGSVGAGYRFRGPFVLELASVAALVPPGVNVPVPSNLERVPCKPGTYSGLSRLFSNQSVSCVLCGVGRASDVHGTIACALCGPGKYSNTPGATECSVCASGTNRNFVVGLSGTSCTRCARNTYAPSQFAERCHPCPACTVRDDSGGADFCVLDTHAAGVTARSEVTMDATLQACLLRSNATLTNGTGVSHARRVLQKLAIYAADMRGQAASSSMRAHLRYRFASGTAIFTFLGFVMWCGMGMALRRMELATVPSSSPTGAGSDAVTSKNANVAGDSEGATLLIGRTMLV